MKTRPLFGFLTALNLLAAILPMQAIQAAAASAAPVNMLQFTAGGHVLGFAGDGMYAATGTHALHVGFMDANRVQPQTDMSTDQQDQAAPLGRVTYADLWDGIDLAYSSGADGIYTTIYTLSPGADPGNIRLLYNAVPSINEDGTLGIAFETGVMTESAPIAWQEINGQRVPVDISFQVSGQEVGFDLGAYDPSFALTIDPTLAWNTFLGGTGNDGALAISVDGSGNSYVTGYSFVSWGSPVRAFTGGVDTFVVKLNSSGGLVWLTFLGGTGNEHGYSIHAAAEGSNIYVTGDSNATWGSPVRAYTSSSRDAFVAKLNSSGSLAWNTFLGGSSQDDGYGITVDGSGNVYVAGASYTTWESPVRAYTSSQDGFAAKLTSAGALSWNTFLGGTQDDGGGGIAVDGSGNLLIAGSSENSWGTPVRAYTDDLDAFAAKLNAATGALTWNTFLGGSGYDGASGIVVSGINAYVSGISDATWGSPVRAYTCDKDAFAAKLNSAGSLSWNTFLGGIGEDKGLDIAADGDGNVYLAGSTSSTWGIPLRAYSAGYDGYAARLNSSGTLISNLFLGSAAGDDATGIAVSGSSVYVSGIGSSTWGDPVRAYTSSTDAFVAKVSLILPGSFNKVAPADGSFTILNPTLSWAESVGADSYEYCIDLINNSTCDSSWISTGPSISVMLSALGNNDTYYWQVRAPGMDGTTAADGGTWWSFTARNQTFADVPIDHSLWEYIEAFYNAGITGGCGFDPLIFCPSNNVTRAAMAVFLLRAKYGAGYAPPPATHTFSDLPVAGKEWQEAWVDQFYLEGITSGCGTSPLRYCPENPVTRAAMAVFILRTLEGPSYTPPAASHFFADMPVAGKEWMEPWVDEVYRRGITTGCGTGPLIFCPENSVKRQAMAAFIVRAFGLPLP